jgi:hypothetical protein
MNNFPLITVILCLIPLAIGISCKPSAYTLHPERARTTLVENARIEIPSVRDLTRLYPDAGLGVYSDNVKKGTTTIQSIQILYDRYEMSLTVDFEVDRNLHIANSKPPSIALIEIVSVEDLPNGRFAENNGKTFRITPDQWRKVVDAGGQFSVLGLEIKTNQPVDGIKQVKAYLKKQYSH